MTLTEKHTQIYRLANQYLTTIIPSEIPPEGLGQYFNISKSFTSINDILYQLLASLQNSQMMPNVIGFRSSLRARAFKEIFYDYNPKMILDNYPSYEELFSKFTDNFEIKNKENKKSLWLRYAKAVISACEFLSTFEDATDFDNFVNSFSYNEYTIASLPMLLEREIYGMGFPLACDFLKELGYTQYPKPDVHIKEVFVAFDLCKDSDFEAYKAVIKMAKINNDTPYNVDKVFWLICSGKFYAHDIQISRHKADFITYVKNSLT